MYLHISPVCRSLLCVYWSSLCIFIDYLCVLVSLIIFLSIACAATYCQVCAVFGILGLCISVCSSY
jgi:hypothetical protein